MIMEQELLEIINAIIKKRGLVEITEINPNLSLRRDLNFDSFDLAELTVRIEDTFLVDIFENGNVDKISEVITKINNTQRKI
jgi:acyl carrier protein